MSVRASYLLAAAGAIACATAGAPSSAPRHDSNVITEQEIADAHASTAYDVIKRQRGNYLQSRGRSSINAATGEFPSVYLDGQVYGDINSLKNIPAQQIHQIRFYSAPEAVTKFGMQNSAGVIEVTTK